MSEFCIRMELPFVLDEIMCVFACGVIFNGWSLCECKNVGAFIDPFFFNCQYVEIIFFLITNGL